MLDQEPHSRRFIWQMSLAFLAASLLAVCFVVLVDPYGIYGILDAPEINRVKPYPQRYQADIKIARAAALGVDTLILGNSRAEIGFDPDHPGFKTLALQPYNLASPGSDVQQYIAIMDSLGANGVKMRMIVAGLDFLSFGVSATQNAPSSSHLSRELRWRFDTLFSFTSVVDAAKTIRIQHSNEAETVAASGLNPRWDYNGIARRDGYYVMFRQRAEENVRQYLRWGRRLDGESLIRSHEFEALRKFLRSAARQDATLHLVIYPYHAQLFALFEESRAWALFEAWKDAVTKEVSAVRLEHPHAQIHLWDYSGYAGYRCEKIPARGDRKTTMQWYWEGAHFKKGLGDLMLDQILLGRPHSQIAGTELVPDRMQENRERILAERSACHQGNPELFSEVQEITEKALSAYR